MIDLNLAERQDQQEPQIVDSATDGIPKSDLDDLNLACLAFAMLHRYETCSGDPVRRDVLRQHLTNIKNALNVAARRLL